MAGWDVDDQVPQAPFRNRLQVVADRAYVDAVNEWRLGLEYVPGLSDEFMKSAPGLLRLQAQVAEGWPARGWRRAVRVVGR